VIPKIRKIAEDLGNTSTSSIKLPNFAIKNNAHIGNRKENVLGKY